MKDALGHGSNPHGSHSIGIDQLGPPRGSRLVPISAIKTNPKYMAWVKANNMDQINSLRENIRTGNRKIPPIRLDGNELDDGAHRLIAYTLEGHSHIAARQLPSKVRTNPDYSWAAQ